MRDWRNWLFYAVYIPVAFGICLVLDLAFRKFLAAIGVN